MNLSRLKLGDFVRAPAGTVLWEEHPSPEARTRRAHQCGCFATRTGASLNYTSVNGFTVIGSQPVYLLKMEVIKSGEPRKPRGRKRED